MHTNTSNNIGRMTDNAEVLFETTGYVKTLYLPSSIKSIEDQPKYAMDNYESGWEPAYMRAENIIVPRGIQRLLHQLIL